MSPVPASEASPPKMNDRAARLAVVVSHPIQYFSPWFAHLAKQPGIELRVFYLWDFGLERRKDRDFGMSLKWDIPLLDGYAYEFVENVNSDPGTHHFNGLNNPSLVARVAVWKPDVILLFGYAYVSHLRIMLSSTLRHIPIILRGDSHNLGRPTGLKATLSRLMRRTLFRRVAAFLAVGKANSAYFLEHARHPGQVFLAPHFVDNLRFQQWSDSHREQARAWRREIGIADDAVVFGFVGKFQDKKRPFDLLKATDRLSPAASSGAASYPATLFAGAGAGLQALRDLAAARIGRDVFFVPFQNQSEMPRVYSAIDVLVLPSGYGETWGLCVNEAMNLGVPAIVSDLVGCGPDLIVPGKTGWTFRSGDIDDLRRALRAALARTQSERSEMAKAVRRHIGAYSVEAATDGLLAAMASVLRDRSIRNA
jgi:glycosyltransferase involved in cell wall biosynthesis